LLLAHPKLSEAGEALIAAANEAGGRDNITVVLLRLEELDSTGSPLLKRPGARQRGDQQQAPANADGDVGRSPTMTAAAPAAVVRRRRPRRPGAAPEPPQRRRHAGLRRTGVLAIVLVVLGLLGAGFYVASQSVYFIGTNNRGLVTMFRGFPYRLPGNLPLYSSEYVSGVSASTLTSGRRHTLLDHSLRSEGNAATLIRDLELGRLE
jgi:protein phosphatase